MVQPSVSAVTQTADASACAVWAKLGPEITSDISQKATTKLYTDAGLSSVPNPLWSQLRQAAQGSPTLARDVANLSETISTGYGETPALQADQWAVMGINHDCAAT